MNARTGELPWDLSGRTKSQEEMKEWWEKRKQEKPPEEKKETEK